MKAQVRHLLRDDDVSSEEQLQIIKVANYLSRKPTAAGESLRGQSIGLFFEKPSLRTRVSSETASVSLGAHPVSLRGDELHLHRGETPQDSMLVLSGYINLMMARVFKQSLLEQFAEPNAIPIVNGLSDDFHPLQAFADLLTLYQEWNGDFKDKTLVYMGDGNNVTASLLLAGAIAGINVSVACPDELAPNKDVVQCAKKIASQNSVKISIFRDPFEAIKDADAVYTDVWASMGEEEQANKKKELLGGYQLNADLLSKAPKSPIILHCLPAHWGEEITREVFDGDSSRIINQAHNRLPATAAVFLFLLAPETFSFIANEA